MRVFDLHADIAYDIYNKYKAGNDASFINEHLPKLVKGEVLSVGVASYFEGTEDWNTMQEMVSYIKKQVHLHKSFIEKNDMQIILTVEGMCGIQEDVEEKIDWLANQGVKIASLCWNEQNALATGKNGEVTRGLTDLGKKVVHRMNHHNMILDVSHANEKTFWDCIETSKKPVIATHSNAKSLCDVDRNLTNQQIKAIAKTGGIIGLNGYRIFISSDNKMPTTDDLVKHAKHIVNLVGVDHLALGFDFMDFLPEYNEDSSPMPLNMPSCVNAQEMIESLKKEFTLEEVEKIAYKNAQRILSL